VHSKSTYFPYRNEVKLVTDEENKEFSRKQERNKYKKMYKKIPKVANLRTKTQVAETNRNSLIKETCTFWNYLAPGRPNETSCKSLTHTALFYLKFPVTMPSVQH
jgi:hypothetical protein